jgi:DNA-binding transcriptional MocR family regulator
MRIAAPALARRLEEWHTGNGPLYRQLARALRELAEVGALEHGIRLPSERSLADALHVSRNTATAAYALLREQGWLDVRRGAAPTLGRAARAPAIDASSGLAPLMTSAATGTIDLAIASPPAAPVVVRGLRDPESLGIDIEELASGSGYFPFGHPELQRAVLAHLRREGIAASADEIVITNGAQQAASMVCATVTNRGIAGLERFSYPGTIEAIIRSGGRPVPLPLVAGDTDVRDVVRFLRAAQPTTLHLSTFQNPTGSALDADAARRVLHAAAASGTVVVEDRSFADLCLDGDIPAPLATLGSTANVITIGSVSKLFWGGLRVGWMHTNPTLAAHLREIRASNDLGTAALVQLLAAQLLAHHVPTTRSWRVRRLRASRMALVASLAEHLPDWRFTVPPGGPSLWVELPSGGSSSLVRRAAAHGVSIVDGAAFAVNATEGDGHLRLPFYRSASELDMAIRRLARAAGVGSVGAGQLAESAIA